jgi:outer membrane protein TolC
VCIISRLRYEHGVADIIELISAQTALAELQVQLDRPNAVFV